MQTIKKLILIFSIGILSIGSVQKRKQMKVIEVSIPSFPKSLDPREVWNYFHFMLVQNVHSTLVRIDENGRLQSYIASKWSIENEGKKFISSGVKLTIIRTAPTAIAGGIISFEAAKTDVELCSLVWILCYGAALLAMGEVAPRSLKRLGWAFIILGSVFFLIWMKFKAAFAPVLGVDYLGSASIMMIVTFGILHIGHGIGVLIRKEKN